MPVIIPFFHANGLSMYEVMLLQAVMGISIVLMEVPSGYVGDILGRKQSIILGCVFGFLGFLIMCFSTLFWHFVIVELLLGLGASFISGSNTALLYDSLLQLGEEEQFVKYQGRLSGIGNMSEAIAGISGGLLASIAIRYPVYVETFLLMFAVFIAFSLKEPPREKLSASDTKQNVSAILKFVWNNASLKWWLIFTGLLGAGTLSCAWITQHFFEELNIDLKFFGILWTAINLTVALGAFLSHRIRKDAYLKWIMAIAIPLICITPIIGGYYLTYLSVGVFFIVAFIRGIIEPLIQNTINRLTTSDIRATVLSFRSFTFRLFFIALGPYTGWLIDKVTLGEAMLMSFGLLLLLTTFSYIALWFAKGFEWSD